MSKIIDWLIMLWRVQFTIDGMFEARYPQYLASYGWQKIRWGVWIHVNRGIICDALDAYLYCMQWHAELCYEIDRLLES